MKFDRLRNFVGNALASVGSIIKVVVMSKVPSSPEKEENGKEIVIMGNGPSMRKTIDEERNWLESHNLMAVNFAAVTPDFFQLRPAYYLMADPVFFNSADVNNNVKTLWSNLENASWPITLLVPTKFSHLVKPLIMNSNEIKLRTFNLTPIEGFGWLKKMLFKAGLGMPRPRNVLIPAIMESIRMGFSKIYICGADHNWLKTLEVDEDNSVVSVQPHFYKDNEEEKVRVKDAYKGLKLHNVLESMTIAFRSYWEIRAYADSRQVEVINITPGSMIDAFKRKERKNH